MTAGCKVVIVAALEREVADLTRRWRPVEREFDGRRYRFYEGPAAALVCGGIGAEFARRATEAAIALYRPAVVVSAGFAGALTPQLKAGEMVLPATVVDLKDGSRRQSALQEILGHAAGGVLITASAIASQEQKAKLAASYGADLVDMEAAAVARGAEAHGLAFIAAKAISDESDLALPAMDRFVGADGQFATGRFVAHVALRPWLWRGVMRLGRNSRLAGKRLSVWLSQGLVVKA